MGFSQTRDGSGVTVVKVDGQLIVGNRQELKDLVLAALDTGERRILIDFSQHRLHRFVRARRPGLHLQAGPRGRRRAAALRTQRGSPHSVRAHQARHALRHRGDSRSRPWPASSPTAMTSPLRLCVRRSPARTGKAPRRSSPCGCPATSPASRRRSSWSCGTVSPATRPPASTRFRLQVCLSEALSNAILRGNREEQDKWVDVRAELFTDVIRVYVTDEGGGLRSRRACRSRSAPSSSTSWVAGASSSSASWWTRSNSTRKGTPSA